MRKGVNTKTFLENPRHGSDYKGNWKDDKPSDKQMARDIQFEIENQRKADAKAKEMVENAPKVSDDKLPLNNTILFEDSIKSTDSINSTASDEPQPTYTMLNNVFGFFNKKGELEETVDSLDFSNTKGGSGNQTKYKRKRNSKIEKHKKNKRTKKNV